MSELHLELDRRCCRRAKLSTIVDVVAARGQVQRGRPAAEPVAAENQDAHAFAVVDRCHRIPHDPGTLCPRAVKRPSDPRRAADSSPTLRFPGAVRPPRAAPRGCPPRAAEHDEDHQLGDDRQRAHDDGRCGEVGVREARGEQPGVRELARAEAAGEKTTTSPKAQAMPAAPATSSGSCQPETAACTRTAAARYPTKAASALPVARHVRERSRRVRSPASAQSDRRDQERGTSRTQTRLLPPRANATPPSASAATSDTMFSAATVATRSTAEPPTRTTRDVGAQIPPGR